jgi:hypothetical protein
MQLTVADLLSDHRLPQQFAHRIATDDIYRKRRALRTV